MVNGTEDLDNAVESLSKIIELVKEEQWSVDYTQSVAPQACAQLSESMSINELQNFALEVVKSTVESDENAEKVIAIMQMTTHILDHYTKLSTIGRVWKSSLVEIEDKIVENNDKLRYYQ